MRRLSSLTTLNFLRSSLLVRKRTMFYRFNRSTGETPEKLKSLDPKGLASYIKSGTVRNVAFLTGAGISVAAGIPDFRSPGGMYDTLRPELLTATPKQKFLMSRDPTSVVSWEIFRENQFPYMELRRPFILGTADMKWKPTLGHFFIRVCEEKKLLRRLYTQNIDGLDYPLNIPNKKIIPLHGTMGKASCEFCGATYDIKQFRNMVKKNIKDIYGKDNFAPKESKNIPCLKCGKPGVKPSTVLFGRSLSNEFFDCTEEDFPEDIDVLFVVGTSLQVGPANMLVTKVKSDCVRVIVNREPVGDDLGIEYGKDSKRDIFCKGNCDEIFLELAIQLGWLADLKAHVKSMAPKSAELLRKALAKSEVKLTNV
mmetsp:Transcript_12396/g.18510  ORF Transcript_12396/g.18510 Transcript_12396/m.18510 type:complete len:368 (-) Transcript_12396:127-1230(-)